MVSHRTQIRQSANENAWLLWLLALAYMYLLARLLSNFSRAASSG